MSGGSGWQPRQARGLGSRRLGSGGYMCCICKQRTSPHKVHGFVQTSKKRTGPKCFSHYGERQNGLYLTFSEKTLCLGKLSCTHTERLQILLDIIRQNKHQWPIKSESYWSVMESMNGYTEPDQTPSSNVCREPSAETFTTEEGSGKTFPQQLLGKSPILAKQGLPEKKDRKRKTTLSSSLDTDEGFLEENESVPSKKFKKDSLKDLEKDGSSKHGPSLRTASPGNSPLDETVLSPQSVSDKSLLLPSVPERAQDDPQHDQDQLCLDSHPEQLQQGFPNLGNTCYMNSILQSLYAIPSFADGLLGQGIPWENIPSDVLIMPLSMLLALKDICNLETSQDLLRDIKNAISAVAEIFSGNMQNDAHEFLCQCLDQLKSDFEKVNTIWKTRREAGDENSPPELLAGDAATKVFVCPVASNFEFELQDYVICKACGQVPVMIEPEECERLCEMCNHKKAVVMQKFGRLPRVFIVHLKCYSLSDTYALMKDDQQLTWQSSDSSVLHVAPDEDAEQNTPQRIWEARPKEQQQSDLASGSNLESKLGNARDREVREMEMLAAASVMDQGDISLLMNCEDESNPINNPDRGLEEVCCQEEPENPEPKDDEKTSTLVELDFDHVSESSKDLCDYEKHKISEGLRGVVEQLHESVTKDIVGMEKTIAKVKEPKGSMQMGDALHSYRLISVISHIGNSPCAGHYISDVYDFQKQAWFTYSDLRVAEIPEAMVQEARLHSGYIFFYMHNDIFF
ncbi:ubiquitin carboxyl-terminal hydrolase 29 [Oryctolagus cuniculus]|uniref:ubiquitin carboxyl-terminal hydrolase 29 n=1 Tax=Oryctolagus cuniculus TaxID=9986 RepID=UPI00387969BF